DGADGIEIFPPVPAAMARRAGYERGQVLVQCPRRAPLQSFLPRWREALVGIGGSKLRWSIDVDPVSF
ncbi:MAG: primosomal protein N', partial [Casimicrobiaceae bacterium]